MYIYIYIHIYIYIYIYIHCIYIYIYIHVITGDGVWLRGPYHMIFPTDIGDSRNTVRGYCLDIPRFEESLNN